MICIFPCIFRRIVAPPVDVPEWFGTVVVYGLIAYYHWVVFDTVIYAAFISVSQKLNVE